jgi:hypothetical protein
MPDDTAKRGAIDVLASEVGVAGVLEGGVDISDVGMAEAGRDQRRLRGTSGAQTLQADEPVDGDLTAHVDHRIGARAHH